MENALSRRVIATAIAIVLFAGSWAGAQEWAQAMINASSYDFGTVARGAKVEHHFTIENIYEEPVQILEVGSTCGCTTPQVSKRMLKTWEKADLAAVVDTRNHLGRKDATIKVTCSFVRADGVSVTGEAQVHVHVFIRGDIVVQPGAIQFGSVPQGTAMAQEAAVSYAIGRSDWQILQIECSNPHIKARAVETGRTATLVNYRLSIQLNGDAPPGYLQDQLVLVTNDLNPRSARVPIPIEGKVEAALSVAPAQLMLGTAEPGKSVARNVVVKGTTPFHVVSARSNDARFQCKISKEARTVHVIPVTFAAEDSEEASGTVNARIRIETDMAGAAAAEVAVSVQTVARRSQPLQTR